MSRGWATGIVFVALLAAAPWPWYLFAVGGLLPVPVILLMAAASSEAALVVALLVCAVIGGVAFFFLARLPGRYSRGARPWAVAGILGFVLLLSQLPIYGGGENIASPAGKFHDAYTAYARQVQELRAR